MLLLLFLCDIYWCDTSYTHAFVSFGSVTSTVTLSITGTGLVTRCVCFLLLSLWLPLALLPPLLFVPLAVLATPAIDAVAVQLLRFERFDTADALLLPREPRRDPSCIYSNASNVYKRTNICWIYCNFVLWGGRKVKRGAGQGWVFCLGTITTDVMIIIMIGWWVILIADIMGSFVTENSGIMSIDLCEFSGEWG